MCSGPMRSLGCSAWAWVAACLLTVGCGDDGGGAGPAEDLGDEVCAEQHQSTLDGHEVVVCDAPFDEAPYVRLPANTSERVFAELRFDDVIDTDGETHPFNPSLDEQTALERSHAVALYAVTLDGGSVEDYAPAVVFDDRLFLEPFLGKAYEGKITRAVPDTDPREWEFESTIDVRVEIGTKTSEDADQADFYDAEATFVNLTEAVTNDAGDCLPSLASFGAEGPFPEGVEISWRAGRVPSMHGYGDDQFVFSFFEDGESTGGSLMSIAWYRGPMAIVDGTLNNEGLYSGVGHGSPSANPNIELSAVSGGGEPCTPD